MVAVQSPAVLLGNRGRSSQVSPEPMEKQGRVQDKLVIHEARYGWADNIWNAKTGSGHNHGGGAKIVTDILRRNVLKNELHVKLNEVHVLNPERQGQYMNNHFWPETAGGPAIARKLAVRYSYGDGPIMTVETRAVSNEIVSLDITPDIGGEVGGAPKIQRKDTPARIERKRAEALTLPISWIVTAICCFWLPLCCFLAAANALPSCEKLDVPIGEEQSLASFIKWYSLICILTGPLIQLPVTLAAYSGNKVCVKYAKLLHILTIVSQLVLMILGWMHYANTTDEHCYDGDGNPSLDHYINPRKMLFGILLAQTIPMGFLCLGSICGTYVFCLGSILVSDQSYLSRISPRLSASSDADPRDIAEKQIQMP